MTTVFIKGQSVVAHYDNVILRQDIAARALALQACQARLRELVSLTVLAALSLATFATAGLLFAA